MNISYRPSAVEILEVPLPKRNIVSRLEVCSRKFVSHYRNDPSSLHDKWTFTDYSKITQAYSVPNSNNNYLTYAIHTCNTDKCKYPNILSIPYSGSPPTKQKRSPRLIAIRHDQYK